MKKVSFKKPILFLLLTIIIVFFQLSKAERPVYLFGHVVAGHFYLDRLRPVLEVTLDGSRVMYEMNAEQWHYQNKKGQWIKQAYDSGSDVIHNGTAAVVSDDAKLEVRSDKAPDYAVLKIMNTNSGKVVLEEQADLNELPLPGVNGKFLYELALFWTDESRAYRGEAVINIPVAVEMPEKFVFSQHKLIQGEMLEVKVFFAENPDDIFLEQSIYEQFRWYQQEDLSEVTFLQTTA